MMFHSPIDQEYCSDYSDGFQNDVKPLKITPQSTFNNTPDHFQWNHFLWFSWGTHVGFWWFISDVSRCSNKQLLHAGLQRRCGWRPWDWTSCGRIAYLEVQKPPQTQLQLYIIWERPRLQIHIVHKFRISWFGDVKTIFFEKQFGNFLD